MKKIYAIEREGESVSVVVINAEDGSWTVLPPNISQQVRCLSPDGFNFGYYGSGPAQLALAILLDHLGTGPAGREESLYRFQRFKIQYIARAQSSSFYLTSPIIEEFLRNDRFDYPWKVTERPTESF